MIGRTTRHPILTCGWSRYIELSITIELPATMTPDTRTEKFESLKRINSIRETNGSFRLCNSCKRLVPSRLHKVHESKLAFVTCIEFIRYKLSNFLLMYLGPSSRRRRPAASCQQQSCGFQGLRGPCTRPARLCTAHCALHCRRRASLVQERLSAHHRPGRCTTAPGVLPSATPAASDGILTAISRCNRRFMPYRRPWGRRPHAFCPVISSRA